MLKDFSGGVGIVVLQRESPTCLVLFVGLFLLACFDLHVVENEIEDPLIESSVLSSERVDKNVDVLQRAGDIKNKERRFVEVPLLGKGSPYAFQTPKNCSTMTRRFFRTWSSGVHTTIPGT